MALHTFSFVLNSFFKHCCLFFFVLSFILKHGSISLCLLLSLFTYFSSFVCLFRPQGLYFPVNPRQWAIGINRKYYIVVILIVQLCCVQFCLF